MGWSLQNQNPGPFSCSPDPYFIQPRGSKPVCLPSHPHIFHHHRNQNCDYFIRPFVPGSQPGEFNLGNIKGES